MRRWTFHSLISSDLFLHSSCFMSMYASMCGHSPSRVSDSTGS